MKIAEQELRITPASFSDAQDLQRAVGTAINMNKIKLDGDINDNLLDSNVSSETISDIINVIISTAISKEVEAALFKCAERAVLGTAKIDRDFFEPVENREYYYPIMIEILKVNLSPFFKGLSSSSGGLLEKVTSILK